MWRSPRLNQPCLWLQKIVKASKKFPFLRPWGRPALFLMATALVSFPRCYAHRPLLTLHIRFRSRSIDCGGFAQKKEITTVEWGHLVSLSADLSIDLFISGNSLRKPCGNSKRLLTLLKTPGLFRRPCTCRYYWFFWLVTTATDKEMYFRNVQWRFNRRKSKSVFNYTNVFYGLCISEYTCTIFPLKSCRASWINVFSRDTINCMTKPKNWQRKL